MTGFRKRVKCAYVSWLDASAETFPVGILWVKTCEMLSPRYVSSLAHDK
jgi:hypothetical protein